MKSSQLKKINSSLLFNGSEFLTGAFGGFPSPESTTYLSQYSEGPSPLYKPSLKAYLAYIGNGLPLWDDSADDECAGVGLVGELTIAEYEELGEKHLAVFNSSKCEFDFVGVTTNDGESYTPYQLATKDKAGKDGTVLWLALLPYLCGEREEIKATIENGLKAINDGAFVERTNTGVWPDSIQKHGYIFAGATFYQVGRTTTDAISVNIPKNGLFVPPDAETVKAGGYKPETVISGTFTITGLSESEKKGKTCKLPSNLSPEDLFCKFPLNPNMTEEERSQVPRMGAWYKVPRKFVEWSYLIWSSCQRGYAADSGVELKNLLVFGPPGGGKTTGLYAVASALGLRAIRILLSSNSDEEVILGGLRPKVSTDIEKETPPCAMSVEEVAMAADAAPAIAYEKITGKKMPDATNIDVWKAYIQRQSPGDGISYEFYTPELVDYIRNGGMVIFDEPTNVRDQGVLIALNQLMDGDQCLRLPSGEVVKRHPNCIIAFSCNTDEAQCNELEASTNRRLLSKLYVPVPPEHQLVARVMSKTGFDDMEVLSTMARIITALERFRETNSFNGVAGESEMTSWLTHFLGLRELYPNKPKEELLRMAAEFCAIPSVSLHSADMQEVRAEVDNLIPHVS